MKINNVVLVVLSSTIALAGCGQGGEMANKPSQEQTHAPQQAEVKDEGKGTGQVYEGTLSGVISDSMCGKDHSGMGELGKDPAVCTQKCVEQGAKFVLVDEKSGDVYNLSDQKKPAKFAGQSVSVDGHIDPTEKAIHVHSLKAK
jgi:predicted small lipoprotein YifL